MHKSFTVCILLLLGLPFSNYAQKEKRIIAEQCGTMQRLENKFRQDPSLRIRFEIEQERFNRLVAQRRFEKVAGPISIPVVFHIVLNNHDLITNAQIQAQLDTLNKIFFGLNEDTVK